MKSNRQVTLLLLTSIICLVLAFVARPQDQRIFFVFTIIGVLSAGFHLWKLNK
jgi:lipopolysaccharide/colanic/teichoic acid biosynthesis glycosyltransferase